jgi:hypothetical protein
MLIGVASLFFLGTAACLIVIALRGKVIDAHPICRKCGFDLHGVTERPLQCPECGRSITQASAMRIGNRKRRAPMLVIGCMIGVLGLACAAGLLPFFSSPAWMSVKPLFLLEWNLSGSQRDVAMAELLRRYRGGTVPAEIVAREARAALAKQKQNADASVIFWDSASGDVIEEAILAGLLSPQEIEQYVRTAISVDLALGDRIHQRMFQPSLTIRTRLASSGQRVRVQVRSVHFEADDLAFMRQLQHGSTGWEHDLWLVLREGLTQTTSGPVPLEGITPGVKQGSARFELEVQDLLGKPLLEKPLTFITEFRVHVIADDRPLIEMYSDSAEKAAFEEEVMIHEVKFREEASNAVGADVTLHIRRAPSWLGGTLKMRLCAEDAGKLPQGVVPFELSIGGIVIDVRSEHKPTFRSVQTIKPHAMASLPKTVCVEVWIEPSTETAATRRVWRMLGDRIELGRVEVENPWK